MNAWGTLISERLAAVVAAAIILSLLGCGKSPPPPTEWAPAEVSQPSESVLPTTEMVGGDTEPPSVPAGLRAELRPGASQTPPSPPFAEVAWEPSQDDTGVAGYLVYRDGVELGSADALVYHDSSVQPNRSYAYTVCAFDAAGNKSEPSSPLNFTTPRPNQPLRTEAATADHTPETPPNPSPSMPPPSAPVNLTRSFNHQKKEFSLQWSPPADGSPVSSYKILHTMDSGAKVGEEFATTTSTDYTFSANRLKQGRNAFRVQAMDAAGRGSPPSAPVTVNMPGQDQ